MSAVSLRWPVGISPEWSFFRFYLEFQIKTNDPYTTATSNEILKIQPRPYPLGIIVCMLTFYARRNPREFQSFPPLNFRTSRHSFFFLQVDLYSKYSDDVNLHLSTISFPQSEVTFTPFDSLTLTLHIWSQFSSSLKCHSSCKGASFRSTCELKVVVSSAKVAVMVDPLAGESTV